MKTLISQLTVLIISTMISAAQDIIVTHGGETIEGKVIYQTAFEVHYQTTNNGNDLVLGKPKVEKIIFSNGLIEPISAKVDIQNERDWDKVMITDNPMLINGLTEKGKSTLTWDIKSGTFPSAKLKKQQERTKRYAAKLHGHIIYIAAQAEPMGTVPIKHLAIIYGY